MEELRHRDGEVGPAHRLRNYDRKNDGTEEAKAWNQEQEDELLEWEPAAEDDWSEEYLDLILSVRVVPDIDAAIDHIERYGSHHSDVIVSNDEPAAERFTTAVDSATVYVNASCRFTDGGQFGMGAEIGVSTDKLHARGPCGVEELTTYKYVNVGSGQVR